MLAFSNNTFPYQLVCLFFTKKKFNFIQQKSPTSISGEMNAISFSIQFGFILRLNEVKASGGDIRF